jgi:hypothetical protein
MMRLEKSVIKRETLSLFPFFLFYLTQEYILKRYETVTTCGSQEPCSSATQVLLGLLDKTNEIK